MIKYTSPRSRALPAVALIGGILVGGVGCADVAPYDQGISALSKSLEAHGYKQLGTSTDRDSVDVVVAVGEKCEADVWTVSDTKVSGEVRIHVATNPDLGKKDVTPDYYLVYENGNYPTYEQLLANPLITRACITANQTSNSPAASIGG